MQYYKQSGSKVLSESNEVGYSYLISAKQGDFVYGRNIVAIVYLAKKVMHSLESAPKNESSRGHKGGYEITVGFNGVVRRSGSFWFQSSPLGCVV